MDYEKKYKEALKDMRAIYPNLKGDAKLAVEHAFPELAESEDERIRKELANFLRSPFIKENLTDEKVAPWIAYLERQKEPIDPFDTKLFQEGVKEGRRLEREDIKKEQKPLSTEETELNSIAFLEQMGYTCIPQGAKPAEWSEEDEKIRRNLMSLLANMRGDRITEETYQKYYPWLKSLRSRPKPSDNWKPSDEQREATPEKYLAAIFNFDDISCLELATDCYKKVKGRAYPITVEHQHKVLMKLYDLIGVDREALDQDKEVE